MNLIDLFDAGARQYPAAPCFAELNGVSHTYAEVQARSCSMARGLLALKMQEGFHAAVLSGNSSLAFIAILAIARAEGVWLPVNVRNAVRANVEFLTDMDCDVLFYQKCWEEQVRQIRESVPRIKHYVCLDGEAGDALSLEQLSRQQPADFFAPAWNPDAIAVILSTGGTTGRSKGVMLSNRNIMAMCANQMSASNVEPKMNYLAAAPITHTAGLLALQYIARGARIVLMDGIDPQQLLRTIEREKIHALFLPPTVIYVLLTQPNVREFDYSSLRTLLYGAAPMSPDKLIEALEVFGPVLMQGYGQSEVPGTISYLRPEDHFADGKVAPRERLMSAGRPYPFTRVAILDEADRVVTQPGVRGEIVAAGEIVMRGYYNNPAATAEASVGGWHRTGDIGYFDADGFLYLVDRKKDMIITGGFNVYSSEVEAALLAHPAIKDCAVIGVPDDKWGEAVKGVVELKPGASADADALIAFVKAQLGGVKTPKTIDVVAELPRSTVGKVLKKELRARFWAEHERSI